MPDELHAEALADLSQRIAAVISEWLRAHPPETTAAVTIGDVWIALMRHGEGRPDAPE